MPSSTTVTFVALGLLGLGLASSAESEVECPQTISEWIQQPEFEVNEATATLTVPWTGLNQRLLSERDCDDDQTKAMSLELWKIDAKGLSSFDGQENDDWCRNLKNQDSARLWDSAHRSNLNQSTAATFIHVYHPHSVLRLKVCHDNDTNRCQDKSTFCSRLDLDLKVKMADHCTKPDDDTKIHLNPVTTSCDRVKVSGEVPLCSPAHKRDQLLVNVHRKGKEDQDQNCSHQDFEQHVTSQHIPIHSLNDSFGTFVFERSDLDPNTTYCLTFELVDYPFCHNFIGPKTGGRQGPSLCTKTVTAKPIRIHSCKSDPNVLTARDNRDPLWICLAVIVAMIILLMVIFYCVCKQSKHLPEELKKRIYPPPDSVKTDLGKHSDTGHILFLYFVESDDFHDLNVQFSEWLKAVGCTIEDLNSEEVLNNADLWMDQRLNDPRMRIVLVNSPVAADVLDATVEISDESQPLLKQDPLFDLRKNLVKNIHSRFCGRYDKLCVVTYDVLPPTSNNLINLTPQVEHSLPNGLEMIRAWLLNKSHVVGLNASEQVKTKEKLFMEALDKFSQRRRRLVTCA